VKENCPPTTETFQKTGRKGPSTPEKGTKVGKNHRDCTPKGGGDHILGTRKVDKGPEDQAVTNLRKVKCKNHPGSKKTKKGGAGRNFAVKGISVEKSTTVPRPNRGRDRHLWGGHNGLKRVVRGTKRAKKLVRSVSVGDRRRVRQKKKKCSKGNVGGETQAPKGERRSDRLGLDTLQQQKDKSGQNGKVRYKSSGIYPALKRQKKKRNQFGPRGIEPSRNSPPEKREETGQKRVEGRQEKKFACSRG